MSAPTTTKIDATELIGALSREDRARMIRTHEDNAGYGASMMVQRFGWTEAQAWAVCGHLDEMDTGDAAFAASAEID